LFSGFGMPANNGQGDAAPEQHQPQEHEGVQGGALGYRLFVFVLVDIFKIDVLRRKPYVSIVEKTSTGFKS
jgi:hypothetical protein